MRFLKILIVLFAILLVSRNALAQDLIAPTQSSPSTFSIGFSLGVPSSIHFSLLDIGGVEGLRLRADVGLFVIPFVGFAQGALNAEYHFAQPQEVGFYFGAGVVVFKILAAGEFLPPEGYYPLQFGGQVYAGLDVGPLFLELGIIQLLTGTNSGSSTVPRIAFGFYIYF